MKSALSSLQEKRDAFDKMKKNYEDTVAYIEVRGIPLCLYVEVTEPFPNCSHAAFVSDPGPVRGETDPGGVR